MSFSFFSAGLSLMDSPAHLIGKDAERIPCLASSITSGWESRSLPWREEVRLGRRRRPLG
jgi:hypothetical protein